MGDWEMKVYDKSTEVEGVREEEEVGRGSKREETEGDRRKSAQLLCHCVCLPVSPVQRLYLIRPDKTIFLLLALGGNVTHLHLISLYQ